MVQVIENAADVEAEVVEWHTESAIAGHARLVIRPLSVEAVAGLPSLVSEDRIGSLLEAHVRLDADTGTPKPGTKRRLRIRLARPNRYFAMFMDASS